MGFPLGLESSTYFSPWSRQTHAASGLLEEPGKNCVFFVLEDPSVGGYSGAPCFDTGIIKLGIATITSSDTKCYGMVRATLSDNTGGKLAVVVPSFYIVELLNEAAPNK
jgi:hypothetical protein